MKKTTILFSMLMQALVLPNVGLAQKFNSYFLKFSGREVATKDSADVIRLIFEPDSGSNFYTVKEFYANYKRKLVGKTSTVGTGRLTLEGECTTYYPTGVKKEVASYDAGVISGDVADYYPNGQLYTVKRYEKKLPDLWLGPNTNFLVISCNDSTGKALVADSSGHYVAYSENFKRVFQQGDIKLGLREGQWTGTIGNENDESTFTETYKEGKFISGQSVDKTGQVYTYTEREIAPSFNGGMQAFYNILARNVRYPKEAKEKHIEGKVILSFVIEKDGSLTDFKMLRAPSPDLGEEALRAIKLSPKWIPGMQYGRPVRVQFTIPVNFTLGN